MGLPVIHPRARRCARPGCSEQAVATLAYGYRDRLMWLDHLVADPDPMTHDLCALHAGRLTAPLGWDFDDRRVVRPHSVPSARAS